MKNRTLLVVTLAIFMLPMLMQTAPSRTHAAQAWQRIDYRPVDVGPEIRTWEATQQRIAAPPVVNLFETEAAALIAAADTPFQDCIADTKTWLSLDSYSGLYFFDTFVLVAESDGAELWIQVDLSFPVGDPRPTPVITCEQAAYLVSEFDNNILPKEVAFFGAPDFHDGVSSLLEAWGYFPPGYFANSAGRQVILVSNIRDDNYYNPGYPNYVAGFYSPTFETYFDRNIMSIDAYDWENRVGPDGSRPYLYDGVFAHEYQHLLHDDYDGDEENFINEGLSMFAEFLTGYVVGNDAYSTFEVLPENSLTAWGDQGGVEIVADYGIVFLYQMYLYEKFGQEFIQYEFHNPDNGIAGVNSTLAIFNIQKTFGDIYHDFSVAVLIDDEQHKSGLYGFDNLEVAIDIGTPGFPNPDAYDTPGAPPWGSDYIWIEGDPRDLAKFSFNGVDAFTSPTPWTSDGDTLYSGTGNLLDNWAIFETTGGGILSIDTFWDLEDLWDFAFVQVSTDGGLTWTSLADSEGHSTSSHDPNAHPTVVGNVPGLTSWVPDWVTLTYDLSAYAGQDILVGFRLVTDWSTHFGGWWIDTVYMDSVEIFDGSDASVFKNLTEVLPINNDFSVTFVGFRDGKKGLAYKVLDMKLDDTTEDGLFELNRVMNWSDDVAMIVTFDAPEGTPYYGAYTYDFTYSEGGPKK